MREDVVLVDTDIFSRVIMTPRNARPEDAALRRIIAGRAVAISLQTRAELRFGALLNWGERRLSQLEGVLASVSLAAMNSDVAEAWARLRVACQQQGHSLTHKQHMGDVGIAATANSLPLASGDRIFRDVPGLTLLHPDD